MLTLNGWFDTFGSILGIPNTSTSRAGVNAGKDFLSYNSPGAWGGVLADAAAWQNYGQTSGQLGRQISPPRPVAPPQDAWKGSDVLAEWFGRSPKVARQSIVDANERTRWNLESLKRSGEWNPDAFKLNPLPGLDFSSSGIPWWFWLGAGGLVLLAIAKKR